VHGLIHFVLFVLLDCPINWSSFQLINRDGILCIYLEERAFDGTLSKMALCPKFLIHNLHLEVVCLPSWFKIRWNFHSERCYTHLLCSRYLHLLELRSTRPSKCLFVLDGTTTLLQSNGSPWGVEIAPHGVGRADLWLIHWLMMPLIKSTGLICLVTYLFEVVIVAWLTRSCLIQDTMAFSPNGSHPCLGTFSCLSTLQLR
jgi:hypothetical protein